MRIIQKSDWRDHKAHCRNMKVMRKKYKNMGKIEVESAEVQGKVSAEVLDDTS